MKDDYNRRFERDFHVQTKSKIARIERSWNLVSLL